MALRSWFVSVLICLSAATGRAENTRAAAPFSVMGTLSDHDLHDVVHETWNAYGQITYISSWKRPFSAAYTNAGGSKSSLLPTAERSFTGTGTVYAGARLWPGGEIRLVPEVIAELPLSHLTGLGSTIQNFELQKTGSETPLLYLSRAYLRHTFEFGGERVVQTSGQMQLGGSVDARRAVITLGNFSILDFFDKNSFASDLRNQFFNMAFLTHAAYDFAADARGYTWGGVAEYYHDAWAVRFGHIVPPQHPNQLPLDFHFYQFYGDQLEIEHAHTLWGQPGVVRLLGYRNVENMARFADALAAYQTDPSKNATTCTGFSYDSGNPQAPDLCWARAPNVKIGIGLNLEQKITDDIGVFARGMISDGDTEVYSYTSTDQSLSVGALSRGTLWHRPADWLGVAFGQGFISADHAAYLNAGGVDGFIGDGHLHKASERVIEVFYSVDVIEALWLSADYQHIDNPAYNADRGPVDIWGARLHAEF